MRHFVRRAFVCLFLLAILSVSTGILPNCEAQQPDDESDKDTLSPDDLFLRDPFSDEPLEFPKKLPPDAELLGRLHDDIFPAAGPARPPYLPARYDLRLDPKKDENNGPEMSPLRRLRLRAYARQYELDRRWARLKKIDLKPKTREDKAKLQLLKYAFGEGPLKDAMAAARRAGDEYRLRLAKLLMEECRFDEATAELAALGEGKIDLTKKKGTQPIANRALALLLRYRDERNALRMKVPVLPTELDVNGYLDRRAKDPAAGALIAARRSLLFAFPTPRHDESLDLIEETIASIQLEELIESISGAGLGDWRRRLTSEYLEKGLQDPDREHLVMTGGEFVLYREGRHWIDGSRAEFKLFSIFNGPIRFRLYRFTSQDELNELTAETLGKLKPQRSWAKTFVPLCDNNRRGPTRQTVAVSDIEEGYYLLLADARYAPMVAACKFLVSDVALYVRAGANQGFAMAVNRRTGRPVPDLPLQMDITRRPDDARVVRALLNGRQKDSDFKQTRRLRTGADGSVSFDLNVGEDGYKYKLDVRRRGESLDGAGLTATKVEYHHPQTAIGGIKAVLWTDQPVHRPGSKVNFKGIVRGFDDLRLADHDPKERKSVEVRAINHDGIMWQGKCDVSAAGTFGGSFKIPLTATLGFCRFHVDGERVSPTTPLLVAEYRLPTYRVGLTVPDGASGGELIKGTVDVTYMTGKPAEGAEVELLLETGEISPPTLVKYTNNEGRVEFSFPLPSVEKEREFTIRAVVADASGQSYSRSDRVVASPNPFQVGVFPKEIFVTEGETVPLVISVRSWEGEPLDGATVVMEGTGQNTKTGKSGFADLNFRVGKEDGARAAHAIVVWQGKVARKSSREILVFPKRKSIHEELLDENGEPLVAPKIHVEDMPSKINVGDPLSFSLKVEGDAEKKYAVCLFAENNLMRESRVLSLSPGEHKMTIETRRDWGPNIDVKAVLLDGKRMVSDDGWCYLIPAEKFLTLEIETDRQEYKPGEKCVARITALDHQGRPVPRAEISLAVVDEAVYMLMYDPTPDLQTFFHQYRVECLCMGNFDSKAPKCESLWYWLGPRYAWGLYPNGGSVAGCSLFASAGGGVSGRGRLSRRVRENFQQTAHWVANLVTDEKGQARTAFTLPDNMTQWRLTARGVTADTKVGQVNVSCRAVLPLQVELALPRGFRAGDRVDLPVVLHNNSDEPRAVSGQTRFGQGELRPWPSLTLKEKADHAFTIPVAVEKAGPTQVFASVNDADDEMGDAIDKTLVALPRGYRFTRSYCGSLHKPVAIVPQRFGKLTERGLTITVRREPGLAGPVCSALDSLIKYPYGCVEQTMSRFMPAVVAGRAIEAAELENPAEERLPEVVAKGIARLASFQHEDGGWGWWRDDQTNDFMTAYVLRGLVLCESLGTPVPPRMIDRAESYLLDRLTKQKLQGRRPASVGDLDLTIYAAHALATSLSLHRTSKEAEKGIADVLAALERAQDTTESPGPLDTILLTDAYRMLSKDDRARKLLAGIAGRVDVNRGDRASIVLAGRLLEVGMAVYPEDDNWPRLARKLVLARRGTTWGDTQTDSAAVRGLAAVLAISGRLENIPVTVRVDGREIGTLSGTQRNEVAVNLPRAERIELNPAKDGVGDFYSISIEGYLERPPKPPANPAARITARVFEVQPTRRELKPNAAGEIRAQRGRTLEIVAEVELREVVSHARFTIPRPCGVELIRPPKCEGGIVASEERDAGLHFFIEQWSPGTHKVRLLVRPELSGRMSTGLPELSPMYDDPLPTAVDSALRWVVE